MNRSIKWLLLIMAMAMLFTSFVACSNEPNNTPTESTEEEDANSETDELGYVYVSPDVNYNGAEFNVLTWKQTDEWVMESDINTPPIDAETFEHFCNVEEEIGIVLNVKESINGNYGYMGEFLSRVSMLSGSDDIDLVCQYSLTAATGAIRGLYTNLLDMDYLNWDAPYWSSDLVASNTFNGQLYYCSGEVTRSTIYNMYVMTYNYSLATDYDLGNLYDLVDQGKWTLETLETLTKDIYIDKNNSEVADEGDLFGLVVALHNDIDAYQYGCELLLLKTNEMGELDINPQLTGDFGISVVEKLTNLFHNSTGSYCGTNEEQHKEAMPQGEAIFQAMTATYVMSLVNPSGIDYGILPMPKYNEEQKEYHTCLGMTHSMFSIPKVANDPDMSAAVLESMAHDGYANLTPYIFENGLKSRYSNRPEDAEMFDILRDGIIYEPGRSLKDVNIFSFVRDAVGKQENIVTKYAGKENQIKAGLNELNFAFS